MNSENDKLRELCLSLMRADTEERVIQILKEAGYWDNPAVWRFYGDLENNYSTIGNQQSRPDAAIVEKLVNSVDARLIKECLARGLKPEAQDVPQSIQEAVAKFFDNADKQKTSLKGRIRDWPDSKRTAVAHGIVLVATGAKPGNGNPSFTIVDCGEGQTPEQMPDTILSLNQSNKLRIPFVQGKFNMGGTGVLEFCGKNNLQLVLSRRSQDILKNMSGASAPDDDKWGFTVVRRENPSDNRKSSVYTYLAPQNVSTNPNWGGVLRFDAEELPIFPEGGKAYARKSGWGTLIKLYEYSATGFSSHLLMKGGLLGRVDLLLPDIALPVRFHECRSYKGHEGSFDTTLTGIRVRLEDDKSSNLEDGFPMAAKMAIAGERMTASIYAFKKGSSEAYRKNEGVIFVVNGQTQGYLTQDFFTRRKVGLSYLADSILVIIDCTNLSGRAREELFMNSRDRLSKGELRQLIEVNLEELLRQHQGLRDLRERRKREEIGSKLDDDKPLEDIIGKLLDQSPTLSNLFMPGARVSTPFKTTEVQAQERTFKGNRFPTYFKFKGKNYGHELHREFHINKNKRCRLTFETDAENDYFDRSNYPGEFTLSCVNGNEQVIVQEYVLNLQNGIASLSFPIPASSTPGSVLNYVTTTNDYGRVEPFKNKFQIIVKGEHKPTSYERKRKRRNPPGEAEGKDRDKPSGITLPRVIEVEEKDWSKRSPPFDESTAMRIKYAGSGEIDDLGSEASLSSSADYHFYINMDNVYLKSEQKTSKTKPALKRAQFKYGMVLLGIAMLRQDVEAQNRKGSEEGRNGNDNDGAIEKRVEEFSRAMAPMMIPMIDYLGSLSIEDEPILDASGEAT